MRYTSTTIYPDPALVALATGVEGANAITFIAVTRPAFAVQWRTLIEGLHQTLLGNTAWALGLPSYLQEIATTLPNSTVAIHVYNPLDCLTHLNMGAARSDPRYFPSLQVICEDSGTRTLQILDGGWSWDGTAPSSPGEVIGRVFGNFEQYFLARVMQCAWELEEEICNLHGLHYHLVECRMEAGQAPLYRKLAIDGGQPRWLPTAGPDTSFRDFLCRNSSYLAQLKEFFRSNTFGSP